VVAFFRLFGRILALGCLAGGLIACSNEVPAREQERKQDQEIPLYQRIETPPAPILTPSQALQAFRLAPGFHIEAVAVEPLLEDPVAMTWDEAGAMYVAEMRAYMPDSHGTGQTEPIGSVARLTDRDGDGRMDHRETLMDGLVLPRALAVVNEGLLIAEPPNLWLCPSDSGRAGDIDCSRRRSLGNYGDQPGSVEHAENGLLQGLDNWLYNAKSNRRLRIRDGALEVETTLFRGQWGIARDNEGRLYYNTNSNLLSGDFFPAEAVVRAGRSAAPGLNERVNTEESMYAIRVNTGVNRAYVPGVLRDDGRLDRPTSASGMAVYRGDQFPGAFSDDIYVTEPAANVVARLVASVSGMAVSTEHALYPDPDWGQREFLASSDERFRPVNIYTGPDGALYVLDFYRGIIQDHVFISPELRAQVEARGLDRPLGMGRVWRITHQDTVAPLFDEDLGLASDDELIGFLGHDNGWRRDVAQRLLQQRAGPSLQNDLRRVVTSQQLEPASEHQAIHALWTLDGMGELDRETVLHAAGSASLELARQALHAGGHLLAPEDLLGLADLNAEDARFQQQLVLTLAAHSGHDRVAAYLRGNLTQNWRDPYRLVAIQAALLDREAQFLESLADGGLWSAEQETETGFVTSVSRQILSGQSISADAVTSLLDMTVAQRENLDWFKRAVLEGIFEATRADGFARVELARPHPLFAGDAADAELWPAIARARRAVTWPGDDLEEGLKPLSPDQQQRMSLGGEYFATHCAACHGPGGQGIPALGPVLVDSPWVTTATERLARIVLHGLQGPIEVGGETWNGVMPGHSSVPEFTDETASGLLTFLHRSWGHRQRAIDPEFIARIRSATEDRGLPWTVEELTRVEINTHYRDYEGVYGPPQFQISFEYLNGSLQIASAILNGAVVEMREDHFLFEPRQTPLEFIRDDAGVVQAVLMGSDSGDGTRLPRVSGL
jgi:glucose/arabinose dehydrogenase/mono/diheme cytochrome c family protein